jgi:hypothetical protein
LREGTFTASMIWSTVKESIGSDLTKISLPVFINEPMTVLQKSAEMMCMSDDFYTKAIWETDPLLRMVYVATSNIASFCMIQGRTAKPFNPLLGETFELVTSSFRFLAEQVSHHPPVCAIHCEGSGWELSKTIHSGINFNGR